MKIAFLARFDLNNLNSGSGTYYFLIRALRELGHEIITYDPINPEAPLICKIRNHCCRTYFGKRYQFFLDQSYACKLGMDATQKTSRFTGDFVLTNDNAIASYYTGATPLVLITDSVFSAIVRTGVYSRYNNLCQANLEQGRRIQDRALQQARKIIYPSEWSCKSAINDHHGDPNKILQIKWGANLEFEKTERPVCRRRPPTIEDCRLLFVGRDWLHKRGDIVLEATAYLHSKQVNASLTIVGTIPGNMTFPESVHVAGYLDKSKKHDLEMLKSLYSLSHFLILPTKAEGYGIVFVEAASFGLPSLGPDHSGVASAIASGRSGILLDSNAKGKHYGETILEMISKPEKYKKLSDSAKEYYLSEANWDLAARAIIASLELD